MLDKSLEHLRHTAAHLLAAAVVELYPNVKLTLGPAIENGFYYDIDFVDVKLSEEELPKIEKKMGDLVKHWSEFTHREVSEDEARQIFAGNEYKLELIDGIVERGEGITLYTCGNLTDLCRGGHCEEPKKELRNFKLLSVAGAYWRGSEENPMLTRIYGTAFFTKEELAHYIWQQEEAKKRDHKKLGRELGLFTISPLIGAGLPLMQPKGMIVRKAIEDYLWELHKDRGYDRVWTPHIAKEDLYVTSGHAAKFGDELFRVQGKEEKFFLKPMNCPHHMQIFADNQFSYRDLPVRYFEPATVYRDEKSGQLGGLTRVRSITQDDGHLFCRVSQIGEEVSTIVSIIKEFYTTIGLMNDYWVRLSVRGEDREQYLGSDEVWEKAEGALEEAAKSMELNYKRVEGEAAFYGPKLDFMFKDAIGREWQLATIQCDFNLPERFDLSYINEAGENERPVVIHRAISGSLERFMGVIVEHFAGAFPLWLSPVQISILPVSSDNHTAGAEEMAQKLRSHGLRVSVDSADESVGKKIRNAAKAKVPYVLVVGDKELGGGDLMVRVRGVEEQVSMGMEDFISKVSLEINSRSL